MSHFVNIKTKITDGAALAAALQRMGFTKNDIEIHEKVKDLQDYRGNLQGKQANIIVRQRALQKLYNFPTNDIGFVRNPDGSYGAILDDGYIEHLPKFMTQVTQFYGVERAKAELRRKRISFVEDMTDKNCPRLRVKL
jgi:hypothetical protein